MSVGKSLLAKLMGSAAPAAAVAVASGKPGLSAEDQANGTAQLEGLAENAFAEGHAAGAAEGRKAERERFGAVLTSEDAVGRTGLAITLLSTTDNTPEQIAGALKAMPVAAAPVAPPVAAGSAAPVAQPIAADPLAAADAIASATPRIDLGAPRPEEGENDEKAVVEIWKGAIAGVGNPGITEGGVWDGLVPARAK